MLKVTVHAEYNGNIIIDHSEITIKNGEVTVIYGPSGSGKSTVINALTLQNEFAQEYFIDDEDFNTLSDYEKRDIICKRFGIVHQLPQLLDDLKIQDHIAMIQDFTEQKIQTVEWIHILELDNTLKKFPNQLSGGEQIRVALLLSLLKNPDYLIFDEPTSSLDEHHRDIVLNIAKICANKGMSVCISTHDEKLIENCDTTYQI